MLRIVRKPFCVSDPMFELLVNENFAGSSLLVWIRGEMRVEQKPIIVLANEMLNGVFVTFSKSDLHEIVLFASMRFGLRVRKKLMWDGSSRCFGDWIIGRVMCLVNIYLN